MINLQLLGTIGKDAVAREVNGKTVINFPVAVDESYKNKNGEKMEKTTWVTASLWTTSDKLLNIFKKGAVVYLDGTPGSRGYVRTSDNTPASEITLNVKNFKVVKFAADSAEAAEEAPAEAGAVVDDLPF